MRRPQKPSNHVRRRRVQRKLWCLGTLRKRRKERLRMVRSRSRLYQAYGVTREGLLRLVDTAW